MSWLVSAAGHLPVAGNLGGALVLAMVSTGCYAMSAVLQEREARRQDAHGAALLLGLMRRPWWWLAVAATVAGAVLHVAALVLGPLSVVQPCGVLTLVLALPLRGFMGGRPVNRRDVAPISDSRYTDRRWSTTCRRAGAGLRDDLPARSRPAYPAVPGRLPVRGHGGRRPRDPPGTC